MERCLFSHLAGEMQVAEADEAVPEIYAITHDKFHHIPAYQHPQLFITSN